MIEAQLRADSRIERLMKNPNWSVAANAAILFLIEGKKCPIVSWRKSSTWAQVDMVFKELSALSPGRPDRLSSSAGVARNQSNIHPMRLTVSVNHARKLIEQIPHKTCSDAIQQQWNVAADATVAEQSVNWLYCWGKTGMGSRHAADEAKRVFDAILPITFSQYEELVDHEHARTHRYR